MSATAPSDLGSSVHAPAGPAEQQLRRYRAEHSNWLDRRVLSECREWLDESDDPALTNRIVDDIERVCTLTRLHWLLDRHVIAALQRLTVPGRPLRLVDACCGNGWYLRHLARRLPAEGIDCELTGVDRSAISIDRARQLAAGLPIRWMVADATRLPFTDRSVDLVISVQSLHHFAAGDALRLLGESLRSARSIFVFDLRRTYLGFLLAWLCRPVSSQAFVHDAALSHRRAYRVAELQHLIDTARLPLAVRPLLPFGLRVVTQPQRQPEPGRTAAVRPS